LNVELGIEQLTHERGRFHLGPDDLSVEDESSKRLERRPAPGRRVRHVTAPGEGTTITVTKWCR
jgi:hypothetical protein